MNTEIHSPRPASRAANAVKHGFCAIKYVSALCVTLAERIRLELMRIHEPGTDEEIDTIEDLALAMAHLQHIESAWDKTVTEDAARASDHYQRQCRAQFKIDLEAWANGPTMHLDSFGGTFEGASYFVRLWTTIVQNMTPGGPGLTFDQAAKAALAKGSCWEISLMNSTGAWIMTRFIRTALDPAGEFRNWVSHSGVSTDRTRAEWYLERTPDRAKCHAELAAEASIQLERWTKRLNELRPDYETKSATAVECFMGILPGDKAQTDKFRLHLRYLTAARNQVERCRKRLDALKKGRNLAAHRSARKADRPAQEPQPETAPVAEPLFSADLAESPIAMKEQAPAPEPELAEATRDQAIETLPAPRGDTIVSEPVRTECQSVSSEFDPDCTTIPTPKPHAASSHVIPGTELLDPRLPLGTRIDNLAKLIGMTFDESFDVDDENSMDFESFATPEEQREFEAWRRRMERSIAQQAFEEES